MFFKKNSKIVSWFQSFPRNYAVVCLSYTDQLWAFSFRFHMRSRGLWRISAWTAAFPGLCSLSVNVNRQHSQNASSSSPVVFLMKVLLFT